MIYLGRGETMKQTQFNCPVEATLSLIGGKYKPLILWHLVDQPLHYMELQRRIPSATPKMLSQQLHDLEGCGMIHREDPGEAAENRVFPDGLWGKHHSRHRFHVSMGDGLSGRIGCAAAMLRRITFTATAAYSRSAY